jgi:hypothetical protein
LMTLDTTSIDVRATGVNRTDNDFALAWTRQYGSGRVFYTALGHFDETWRDARFQRMLEQALLWITGQIPGDGQPRTPVTPAIAEGGVGNAATLQPSNTISPGSFVSIYGANLTSGATLAADIRSGPYRLAGTRILLNGQPAQVIYASPGQINFLAPLTLEGVRGGVAVDLTIETPGTQPLSRTITFAPATPGVFTQTIEGKYATLWSTGLGAVRQDGAFFTTVISPRVLVNGQSTAVLFSGLAPGWPGLYQVNIELPATAAPPYRFELLLP